MVLAEATATVSVGISSSDEPDLALIRSSHCLNMLGHPILVPSSAPASQPATPPPSPIQRRDNRDDWAHHIAQISNSSLVLIRALATAHAGVFTTVSSDIDVDDLYEKVLEMACSLSFVAEEVVEKLQSRSTAGFGGYSDSDSVDRASSTLAEEFV